MLPGNKSLPDRIFAVGDIHGRHDLLLIALQFVKEHAAKLQIEPVVYFLGDVVDYGEHSANVIDRVSETLERWPGSKLFLGNHDEWFRRFLEGDFSKVGNWLRQGGLATISSYGIVILDEDDLRLAAATIQSEHADHLTLFRNAAIIEIVGKFAFVHAGVDPERSIDDQDPYQCLWMREPFLSYKGPLPYVVVHGHTVTEPHRLPVQTPVRIGLDTGAYFTDRLSVALIDPLRTDGIEFFQTRFDGIVPVEPRSA